MDKVMDMENGVTNDDMIREYLLGRLEADSELVERIDEQIFTDPEFSVSLDIIEDEIIEEYLDGSLSPEDAQAVETHFLRPPERQRKLKTARLLNRYFEAESRKLKGRRAAPRLLLFQAFSGGWTLPSFRTCAEIAGSGVLILTIVILWNQRRGLDAAVKQTSQQLAQERQRSAVSTQQLQSALNPLPSTIAMLNLVRPGLERGASDLQVVKVNSATTAMRVEVALSFRSTGKYHVQLRHLGTVAWSRDALHATAVTGGAILTLDIPAEVLSQGTYVLEVMPTGASMISYWFSVLRSN